MQTAMSVALLFILLPSQAGPVAPSDPTLNPLLDRIAELAASYRATLPSLGADEAITSQGYGFGPFRQKAEARGTFRVTRKAYDAPLEESRQITELNGKPVPEGHAVHLPLTFGGAFGDALDIFFAPAIRPCLDFFLTPRLLSDGSQEIRFTGHPGSEDNPACAHTPQGVAGFVRIDPVSCHIRHLERTVPEAFAEPRHLATFAAVDYAPTQVGDDSFWLPTAIEARIGERSGGRAEFKARYSNYHRFTGTLKLLPNVSPVDVPPR